MKTIFIYGAGYVGYSLAVALSKNNKVVIVDKDEEKVRLINQGIVPIKDNYIEKFIKENQIKLTAVSLHRENLTDSDYVFLCTPTNYDREIR